MVLAAGELHRCSALLHAWPDSHGHSLHSLLDKRHRRVGALAQTYSAMSKRFQRGLVVGKFSPLHRGHEFVINRALEECAEVFLISYSKPEMPGCEAARRDLWVASIFPQVRHLAVTDERLREWIKPGQTPREVPANDADEKTHRRFCGFL